MPGYLSQGSAPQHMHSDGKGGYVCEWCSVWMCKCCSKLGCDLATPARGSWSAKTFKCGGSGCSKKGDGGWHIKPEELVAPSEVTTPSEEDTCVICLEATSNTGLLHGGSMHKPVGTGKLRRSYSSGRGLLKPWFRMFLESAPSAKLAIAFAVCNLSSSPEFSSLLQSVQTT
eukprot:gene23676-9214_t